MLRVAELFAEHVVMAVRGKSLMLGNVAHHVLKLWVPEQVQFVSVIVDQRTVPRDVIFTKCCENTDGW
jgi:hypothetical protein